MSPSSTKTIRYARMTTIQACPTGASRTTSGLRLVSILCAELQHSVFQLSQFEKAGVETLPAADPVHTPIPITILRLSPGGYGMVRPCFLT